ncbi:cell wall hydrolase [Enterobacter ludwigii]|uniref:cell wall hydrolase n=1 Tax=Enterobacter ludwigii TaxID=299767 RepID=UPI003BEF15B4
MKQLSIIWVMLLSLLSSFNAIGSEFKIDKSYYIENVKNEGKTYLLNVVANIATRMYIHNKSSLRISNEQRKSLDCMIKNVYLEARGEDLYGKILVSNVVQNRMKSKHYPYSICGVIYQPHQFSWTNNKKLVNGVDVHQSTKEYKESVWTGIYSVLMDGASYTNAVSYYAPKRLNKSPSWSDSRQFAYCGSHGGHRFYVST